MAAGPAEAATTVYTSRATFLAQLTTQDTDTFSAAGYFQGDVIDDPTFDVHTSASMSAIRGETIFLSTGHNNINILETQTTDPAYCAGGGQGGD